MAKTYLEVHVLLAAVAQPAAVDIQVYRLYESGWVLLAADGAMEEPALGPPSGRASWRHGALLRRWVSPPRRSSMWGQTAPLPP